MSANESAETARPSNPPDGAHPAPAAGAIAPVSRHGGGPVNAVEHAIEHGLDRIWARFTHRPLVGAAIAGGVGLTVAATFGAAEIALAAGVGYAAYKVFKRRVPPAQALKEAFRVEKQLTEG